MNLLLIFNGLFWLCTGHAYCKEGNMPLPPKYTNLFGEPGQAYALKVSLGTDMEMFDMILDTGSASLAVAGYPRYDNDIYYHYNMSSAMIDSGKQVHAKYSQGSWKGILVSDIIHFHLPNMSDVPLRVDFAVINESESFFMDGPSFQGIMGLAYKRVNAWGDTKLLGSGSVLDAVSRHFQSEISFEFKLCGPISETNLTHHGYFWFTDDNYIKTHNVQPKAFYTPILHEYWYEIAVLAVHVVNLKPVEKSKDISTLMPFGSPVPSDCKILNAEKSILDTGTTDIRLPDAIFNRVVAQMIAKTRCFDEDLADFEDFWYNGEPVCYAESRFWHILMPWITIDILYSIEDNTFFTLILPPENFMRPVAVDPDMFNTSEVYCYKLGLQVGGKETVLGYTAMEGFEVMFSRKNRTIGWSSSSCGPRARVVGPFGSKYPLAQACDLFEEARLTSILQVVQFVLMIISAVTGAILLSIIFPCVRQVRKPRHSTTLLLANNDLSMEPA